MLLLTLIAPAGVRAQLPSFLDPARSITGSEAVAIGSALRVEAAAAGFDPLRFSFQDHLGTRAKKRLLSSAQGDVEARYRMDATLSASLSKNLSVNINRGEAGSLVISERLARLLLFGNVGADSVAIEEDLGQSSTRRLSHTSLGLGRSFDTPAAPGGGNLAVGVRVRIGVVDRSEHIRDEGSLVLADPTQVSLMASRVSASSGYFLSADFGAEWAAPPWSASFDLEDLALLSGVRNETISRTDYLAILSVAGGVDTLRQTIAFKDLAPSHQADALSRLAAPVTSSRIRVGVAYRAAGGDEYGVTIRAMAGSQLTNALEASLFTAQPIGSCFTGSGGPAIGGSTLRLHGGIACVIAPLTLLVEGARSFGAETSWTLLGGVRVALQR